MMNELCPNCGLGLPCECGFVQGAPRNKPLEDNSLSEAFTTPDIEKQLSDALTGEGNNSKWVYGGEVGSFTAGEYLREDGTPICWNLGPFGDTRKGWMGDLEKPDALKLVKAADIQPTVSAPTSTTKEGLK